MRPLYQVTYQNPHGSAIHETKDFDEAVFYFDSFLSLLINGSDWSPTSFGEPRRENGRPTEGHAILTKENERSGKVATVLHLNIINSK